MSYLEKCIEVGIREGLDVSWFVKEDWDYDQLWEIRKGVIVTGKQIGRAHV